ncbi:MAG: pyruvate kinase [Planctomycetes bacterium]|nr:pyruvate kinase [Planctomycetota bacterium]
MLKYTKIVATLGPATDGPELEKIIAAGVDVVRLNASHGQWDEHKKRIDEVRKVNAGRNVPVSILVDLPGPKYRTVLTGDSLNLVPGETISFCESLESLSIPGFACTEPRLPKALHKGDRVLLSDGTFELQVTEEHKFGVFCKVIMGGTLTKKKGINVPGARLDLPTITELDIKFATLAVEEGVDAIALSFVQSGDDILTMKENLPPGKIPPIFAKIERPEAIENFEGILEQTDGILIARGDLGVEVDIETVPVLQKRMIARCIEKGKPVITATQMLESMTTNLRPTRAEVSDVANAVLDGTDAVMLSGETSVGIDPSNVVDLMAKIIRTTSHEIPWRKTNVERRADKPGDYIDAIAHAVADICEDVDASLLIVNTETGRTINAVSRYRLKMPVLAVTSNRRTFGLLHFVYGVIPCFAEEIATLGQLEAFVYRFATKVGIAKSPKPCVYIAGEPLHLEQNTDLIRIRPFPRSSKTGQVVKPPEIQKQG